MLAVTIAPDPVPFSNWNRQLAPKLMGISSSMQGTQFTSCVKLCHASSHMHAHDTNLSLSLDERPGQKAGGAAVAAVPGDTRLARARHGCE
jgi:hypothetical protein